MKLLAGLALVFVLTLASCGGSPSSSSSGGTVHAAGFTNASVIGGYGFALTGVSFLQPFSGTGVVTADGNGNLTAGEETENVNGTVSCHATLSGTYSINANGTGAATINAVLDAASIAAGCRNSGATHLSLALSNGGSQLAFAEQDVNVVDTGVATKQ